MEALLLLIIFGLGASYFATQNTGTVHILLGNFLVNHIPLYIVVIGSILLGVFMSWLLSIVRTFSLFFTLQGKDHALQKAAKEIALLQEKNQQLEEKIAALSAEESEKTVEQSDKNVSLGEPPSLLKHIQHGFGLRPS